MAFEFASADDIEEIDLSGDIDAILVERAQSILDTGPVVPHAVWMPLTSRALWPPLQGAFVEAGPKVSQPVAVPLPEPVGAA